MKNDFYILGVGMSAGGLQSLREFFAALDADLPLSIILATHLQIEHFDKIFDIIPGKSKMQVKRVNESMEIKKGCIYVLDVGIEAEVEGSVLKISQNHNAKYTIDLLFSSLAGEFQDRVIGMILSGTGSDGAQGLLDISKYGGQVLIQEPFSALYQHLPRLAIKVDHPDKILPPIRLANWLNKTFKITEIKS